MKPVYSFFNVSDAMAQEALIKRASRFGIDVYRLSTQGLCSEGTLATNERRLRGRSLAYLATVVDLPTTGSTLVTETSGMPSMGVLVSMAVLVLRALRLLQRNVLDQHTEPHVVRGSRLDDVRRRLSAIGEMDSPVWRPRTLPTSLQPWTNDSDFEVTTLEANCAGPSDLSLLVASTAAWILWGLDGVAEADQEVLTLIFDACDATTCGFAVRPSVDEAVAHFREHSYQAAVMRSDMVRWLKEGSCPVHVASTAALVGDSALFQVTRQRVRNPLELVLHDGGGGQDIGQLCVVETAHKAAVQVGFRVAPVVLHAPPATATMSRAYTVAAWSGSQVDMEGAHADLAALEDGWSLGDGWWLTLTPGSCRLTAPPAGSHLGLGVVVATVGKRLARQA